MMELRPITADNYWQIIDLTVREGQEEFVTSNAVSLGQAYAQPECKPLAIYAGETPVGFLMYCIDRDDSEYWLYRLMIDRGYQGRGYARAALRQWIANIQKDTARHKILLGVDKRGEAAIKLYQSLGFQFTG